MKMYRTSTALCLIVSILLLSGRQASATTSEVILNLEGSPSCSSLAINSVLEAKDPNPPGVGETKSITGPDGQQFTYTIGTDDPASPGDQVSMWNTTFAGDLKPVSFVILKAQGNAGARVFHFNTAGAISDTDETATGKITSISFCYGLADPLAPAQLPACDPSLCPADPNATRLIIQVDEPDGANWQVQTCSCGPAFTECNPSATAGAADACTNGNGALLYLPTSIELGRDPDSYYCTVLNGTRYCFRK